MDISIRLFLLAGASTLLSKENQSFIVYLKSKNVSFLFKNTFSRLKGKPDLNQVFVSPSDMQISTSAIMCSRLTFTVH